MVGVILTVLAVLFVICLAFCYSDHPAGHGPRSDALFFLKSRSLKTGAGRGNLRK